MKAPNDSLTEDQLQIVRYLVEQGPTSVEELVKHIGKSRATVYNNLHKIQNLSVQGSGKLYSLGLTPDPLRNTVIGDKLNAYVSQKECLAEAIVNELQPGATVFLDCGTTSLKVAEKIVEYGKFNLTIVTISPLILNLLFHNDHDFNVIMGPGALRPHIGAIGGDLTRKFIENLEHVDYVVVGIDTVSKDPCDGNKRQKGRTKFDWSLWSNYELEVAQKRAMLSQKSKVFIPVDDSKLMRKQLNRVTTLNKLSDNGINYTFLIGVDKNHKEAAEVFVEGLPKTRYQILVA